jgi:exocyst complex component 4
MSRSNTAKYKISQPQPLVSPEVRNNGSPYPSFNVEASSSSPLRPARSQRRNDPPPARRGLAPLQMHHIAADPMPSPITPTSAVEPSFADPWEADRSQRSQLRAQTSAAAQQANLPQGGDKLRNVVGAFMSAGRRQEEPRKPAKKKSQPEPVWEVGGGKFAEIDGRLICWD